MRPIFASLIITIPLLALLVYLVFFVTEVTAGEAGGLVALLLILACQLLLVFIIYPLVKTYSKSSCLLFMAFIFFIGAVLGISTTFIMFGSQVVTDISLLFNAALMAAVPSFPLSALWWWLVKTHNPSFKRDA